MQNICFTWNGSEYVGIDNLSNIYILICYGYGPTSYTLNGILADSSSTCDLLIFNNVNGYNITITTDNTCCIVSSSSSSSSSGSGIPYVDTCINCNGSNPQFFYLCMSGWCTDPCSPCNVCDTLNGNWKFTNSDPSSAIQTAIEGVDSGVGSGCYWLSNNFIWCDGSIEQFVIWRGSDSNLYLGIINDTTDSINLGAIDGIPAYWNLTSDSTCSNSIIGIFTQSYCFSSFEVNNTVIQYNLDISPLANCYPYCAGCPANDAPTTLYLFVNGFTDGSCTDCSTLNGIFTCTFTFDDNEGCSWQSESFTHCGDCAYWVIQKFDTNPSTWGVWIYSSSTFGWGGSYSFVWAGDSLSNCSDIFPMALTVIPVNIDFYYCNPPQTIVISDTNPSNPLIPATCCDGSGGTCGSAYTNLYLTANTTATDNTGFAPCLSGTDCARLFAAPGQNIVVTFNSCTSCMPCQWDTTFNTLPNPDNLTNSCLTTNTGCSILGWTVYFVCDSSSDTTYGSSGWVAILAPCLYAAGQSAVYTDRSATDCSMFPVTLTLENPSSTVTVQDYTSGPLGNLCGNIPATITITE